MDGYLNWIKRIIRDENGWKIAAHTKLIDRMHRTPFLVSDPNDQPRENDGYDLRWRYAWECNLADTDTIIVPEVPNERCSVLEMMTALALRADENFKSNRSTVPNLFWEMVKSMGLLGETDNMYDDINVIRHIDIFNNRLYAPNGHGGLFTFPDTNEDMRSISIWDQLCRWYNINSPEFN